MTFTTKNYWWFSILLLGYFIFLAIYDQFLIIIAQFPLVMIICYESIKTTITIHETALEFETTFLGWSIHKKQMLEHRKIQKLEIKNSYFIKITCHDNQTLRLYKIHTRKPEIVYALQSFCEQHAIPFEKSRELQIAEKGRKLKEASEAYEKSRKSN